MIENAILKLMFIHQKEMAFMQSIIKIPHHRFALNICSKKYRLGVFFFDD